MRAIVVLLIALVGSKALYTNKYQMDYSERRNIMQIMTEVESKLKSGHASETVNGVLDGFKDAVNQEQAIHDEVYQKQKNECDSEIGYRKTEVEDATNTLRDANLQIRGCTMQQGKTQSALASTGDNLIQNNQHLDLINDVRRQETANFNKAAVSFNDAINAIDDCIDLAGTFATGGGSFVQVAKMTARLAKHAVKLGKSSAYKAAMGALVQLTQEDSSTSDVERLVQLLATLRTNLENAWNEFGSDNENSLAAFNEQKERITDNVKRLETQEQKLEFQLEELTGCIATQVSHPNPSFLRQLSPRPPPTSSKETSNS